MSQPGPSTATSRTESADDGGPFGRQLVAATPRVLAFVRTLCRGGVVGVGVEDLVQETLVRAWRSRETFDASKGTAETWLSRIAFCVYLDPGLELALTATWFYLRKPIPTFVTTLGVGKPVTIQVPEVRKVQLEAAVALPADHVVVLLLPALLGNRCIAVLRVEPFAADPPKERGR